MVVEQHFVLQPRLVSTRVEHADDGVERARLQALEQVVERPVVDGDGHVGMRVERPSDVEPALREAFGKYADRLVFLDILTHKGANVFPMVAAGKGLSEMILADEEL